VGRRMVDVIGVLDRSSDQRYVERLPHPGLRSVISFGFVQQVSEDAPPYVHRSVPNGSIEVSYQLGSAIPVVTGAHHGPNVFTLEPGSVLAGVRLRPGAAEAVLGIPASELTDRRVPLDFVWGRSSNELVSRLADATSAKEASTLLEQALLARAATAAEPDPVVGELVKRLQPWRARRVTDQASDLFLSPRHLRRRCLEAIGQGPKVLHRILRFQAFLVLTEGADGDADLAGAAMTAGYADQAHLTRECSRLSGLTPRSFQAERAARCLGSHDHGPSLMHVRRALRRAGAPNPEPSVSFKTGRPAPS
jgi:AraC-like DNA-binding protein